MGILQFVEAMLRGLGQVMLQNNWVTGIAFLAGIFYSSPIMGMGALLGVFAGTIAAVLLGYEKKEVEGGFFGANGALVGIAMFFFFQGSVLMAVFALIGASLSTLVRKIMLEKHILPFTFPFVLVSWASFIVLSAMGIPQAVHGATSTTALDAVSSVLLGAGQVMFQANAITGALFIIGLAASSAVVAGYALFGAALGAAAALMLGFSLSSVNLGIFGFNAVLCGIAFADKKPISIAFAAVAIIFSVLIIQGMLASGVIALTSPFVFATWLTIVIRNKISKK
jgi:urea transporter